MHQKFYELIENAARKYGEQPNLTHEIAAVAYPKKEMQNECAYHQRKLEENRLHGCHCKDFSDSAMENGVSARACRLNDMKSIRGCQSCVTPGFVTATGWSAAVYGWMKVRLEGQEEQLQSYELKARDLASRVCG